jgi:hypothetical protein
MNGLLPARVSGEAACVTEPVESGSTPGQDLVHVCLMADVPDETVTGGVEHPMEGDRQLDDTEIRGKVAAGLGDPVEDEGADLLAEELELLIAEGSKI